MKTSSFKSLLTSLVAMLVVVSANAYDVLIDGISYNLVVEAKQAIVTRRDDGGYSGEVIIPSTVTYNDVTYDVTSIGSDAFNYCQKLTSVNIPSSVTSIGAFAFFYCSSLTSVTIPEGVTSIGEYAFQFCTGLTSVKISSSVNSIGSSAFFECRGLVSITLSEGVKNIGGSAFYRCERLNSIIIPSSVTSIGSSAFYRCTGLTSTTILSDVTNYGSNVFQDCGGELVMGCNIPDGTSRQGVFYGSKFSKITLLDGVESVGKYAFYNNTGLKEMVLPESLTLLGSFAFQGCASLTSVTIPSGVSELENYTFSGCSRLQSVSLTAGLKKIGNLVFENCTQLSSITLPDGLTDIGNSAFKGCTALDNIHIPASVTNLGNTVFTGCKGELTLGCNIPDGSSSTGPLYGSKFSKIIVLDGVKNIGSYAFYNNSELQTLEIPNGVETIGNSAFQGCTKVEYIHVPNTVTSIGTSVFSACKGRVEIDCEIPDGRAIKSVFYQHRLSEVTFGKDVKSIGSYALYNSKTLKSLTIPEGVSHIGACAFQDCSGVESVYSISAVPSECAEDAFDGKTCQATLYVPIGSREAYAAATGWSKFGNIEEKNLESVVSLPQRDDNRTDGKYLIDGKVTIRKDGRMYDTNGRVLK